MSSRRRFKRKMIKELGVETYSDRIKRKIKDASSRGLRDNTTRTGADKEA